MNEERYKEFLTEMDRCAKSDNTEMAHYEADELLCKFLVECGYDELVDKFDNVNKWYA